MYQKPLSSDKYQLRKNINDMLVIAEALQTATGWPVLVGACKLHYLSYNIAVGAKHQSPFDDHFFVLLESECHDLPIFDDFRALCSTEHLQRSETRINELADSVEQEVRKKCKEILAKFEKTDLELLECELNDEFF